ncbi:MAG TPA: hypothetical protein VLL05_17820 [Terriglobales bacterium]|nr:hypothetical protein [Terriglobales bacterium]
MKEEARAQIVVIWNEQLKPWLKQAEDALEFAKKHEGKDALGRITSPPALFSRQADSQYEPLKSAEAILVPGSCSFQRLSIDQFVNGSGQQQDFSSPTNPGPGIGGGRCFYSAFSQTDKSQGTMQLAACAGHALVNRVLTRFINSPDPDIDAEISIATACFMTELAVPQAGVVTADADILVELFQPGVTPVPADLPISINAGDLSAGGVPDFFGVTAVQGSIAVTLEAYDVAAGTFRRATSPKIFLGAGQASTSAQPSIFTDIRQFAVPRVSLANPPRRAGTNINLFRVYVEATMWAFAAPGRRSLPKWAAVDIRPPASDDCLTLVLFERRSTAQIRIPEVRVLICGPNLGSV